MLYCFILDSAQCWCTAFSDLQYVQLAMIFFGFSCAFLGRKPTRFVSIRWQCICCTGFWMHANDANAYVMHHCIASTCNISSTETNSIWIFSRFLLYFSGAFVAHLWTVFRWCETRTNFSHRREKERECAQNEFLGIFFSSIYLIHKWEYVFIFLLLLLFICVSIAVISFSFFLWEFIFNECCCWCCNSTPPINLMIDWYCNKFYFSVSLKSKLN